MGNKTAIFTIIAKNYLPYARVLMRSAATIHPEWQRFVILVDQVDGYFVPRAEDFEIVLLSELPIPRLRWFQFKYSTVELSTAVKPYAFEYLFGSRTLDRIVYLDPDIRIYSPLHKVVGALVTAEIALTPHLTASLDDDKRPTEIDILRSGVYNLGFIAISRSRNAASFLMWWQQRLYDHCVVDLPRGLFVDQRWVDLVPGMFEGVTIVRDPGYNVAYWNLSHRRIIATDSGYEVNGGPLCFFHFSGYDPAQPDQLSRHQNRHTMMSVSAATRTIIRDYHRDLVAAGHSECRRWPYTYATFKNGTTIPDIGRPIHHENPDIVERIEDPFSEEGFQAFLEVWNGPVEDGSPVWPGISRLAYRIYRTRTDVQSAMPDIFGSDYKRFLKWMLVSGKVEHGLGDVFLTSVADAIRFIKGFQERPGVPVMASQNEFAGTEVGGRHSGANGTPRLRLTRLALAIYESRAELQRYFPDPCGHDSARFLVWLLSYGRREHHLSPLNLMPMRAQWRTVVGSQPTVARRLRYELTLRAMTASVIVRGAIASVTRFCKGLRRVRSIEIGATASARAVAQPPEEFGVNLVGYFRSRTGMGEVVRAADRALTATGVPIVRRAVHDAGPGCNEEEGSDHAPATVPYSHSLMCVNADQTDIVRRSLGDALYLHRHSIGYWLWELDVFPDRWAKAFGAYQEIWTPSSFCRDAIVRVAPVPVFRVPLAVAPEEPVGIDRQHFGLDPDRFIFLYAFDMLSVPERKNPIAAVRAFAQAFGGESRCQLVIKVNHAGAQPHFIEALRAACTSEGVRIVDSGLSRQEMSALTRCADCLVSLHRSEGFGLLIAEAMYFGKPVIVTNYSGNTDFTHPDNSLLVNYRLIPVGPGHEPYSASNMWADPDIEHAAHHMRTIVESPDLRAQLSAAGSEFIRAHLSIEAVGRAMRERLEASAIRVRQAYPLLPAPRQSPVL